MCLVERIQRRRADRRAHERDMIVRVLASTAGELSVAELADALFLARYELGVCLRQLERAGKVRSRLIGEAEGELERLYRLAEPEDATPTGPICPPAAG